MKIKLASACAVAAIVATSVLYQNCAPFSSRGATPRATTLTVASSSSLAAPIVDPSGKFELIPLTEEGVNAGSFFQDPLDSRLLWGRRMIFRGLPGENPADEGTWTSWTPALWRLDEQGQHLHFLKRVFTEPVRLADGRLVTTGYDPSVIVFQNKRYIAFECAGEGFTGSVGACVGELDGDGLLIASRTRVVVDGLSASPSSGYNASASVPKLMLQNGVVTLAWTAVRVSKSDGRFLGLTSRAAYLAFNAQGLWQTANSAATITSEGPASVEIFKPEVADGTADVFQLYPLGSDRMIITGATGGSGCVTPIDPVANCYALTVRAGSSSINANSVNQLSPILTDLPVNPQEYFRVIRAVNGKPALIGRYLTPSPQNPANRQVPASMYLIRHRDLEALVPAQAVSGRVLPPQSIVKTWTQMSAGAPRLVTRLYEELLARTPTAGELNGQIQSASASGLSCKGILNNFALSPEFQMNRLGLDPVEMIGRMYQGVLGRAVDADGLQAHVAIEATRGFEGVRASLVDSAEALAKCQQEGNVTLPNLKSWRSLQPGPNRLITRFYEELLGRTPADTEVADWRARSSDCTVLSNGVLQSPEFNGMRSGLQPAALARRLYWSILAREGDTGGIEGVVNGINAGQYELMRTNLLGSPEAAQVCRADGL